MAHRIVERIMHGPAAEAAAVPLGGTRSQAWHRLQIGVTGIVGIILMVALADTLREQADQTDAVTVPEATVAEPGEPKAAPQSDPLAGAGVVPDLPADPAEAAAQDQPVLPEQGTLPAAEGAGNGGEN